MMTLLLFTAIAAAALERERLERENREAAGRMLYAPAPLPYPNRPELVANEDDLWPGHA